MILCIGTTPALQRVMVFRKMALDAVNRAVTTLDGVAGKSVNVAKVLHALGETPVAVGFLGGERGERMRAELAARGIAMDFVTVPAQTRLCVTVIDESTGHHTELVEEGQPVAPEDYARLLAIIRQRLLGNHGQPPSPAPPLGANAQPGRLRAMVMSGTLARGGPADFYAQCTRLARQAGVLSIVDAQATALLESLPAEPSVVKPNRVELAAAVRRDLPDDAAVMAAMRELAGRGAQQVIVTAGTAPTLACDGRSFWRIFPPPLKAVNPIGSGDAFTAGLAWRLVQGEELGEACRWASAAGSANALTLMAGEVNRADVDLLASKVKVERVG